jgi:hypothetical protein
MIKKIIVSALAAGLVLVATPPVTAAQTASTTPAMSQTVGKKYTNKMKNRYWNAVKNKDSDAYIIGKKEIAEMGTVTCDMLRLGGDIEDLADFISDADDIIYDLLVTAVSYAPIYLCRDQLYKFDY